MYCKKCGKLLPGEADLCRDCFDQANKAAQQTPYYGRPPVVAVPVDRDNRMYGFGKALASTIMSESAFIAVIFSFVFFFEMIATDAGPIEIMTAFVSYVALFAVIVVALVFGIRSISTYSRRSREGCAKPVPTLVLGIIGVVSSAIALIYALYFGILYFGIISSILF